jgi:hypothetical protein
MRMGKILQAVLLAGALAAPTAPALLPAAEDVTALKPGDEHALSINIHEQVPPVRAQAPRRPPASGSPSARPRDDSRTKVIYLDPSKPADPPPPRRQPGEGDPCQVVEAEFLRLAEERDRLNEELMSSREELNRLTVDILSLQRENEKLKKRVEALESRPPVENPALRMANLPRQPTASKPAKPPQPVETPPAEARPESPPGILEAVYQQAFTRAIAASLVLKERFYTVQTGDSLWSIARKHQISVKSIKHINNLEGNRIKPGQVLRLP